MFVGSSPFGAVNCQHAHLLRVDFVRRGLELAAVASRTYEARCSA